MCTKEAFRRAQTLVSNPLCPLQLLSNSRLGRADPGILRRTGATPPFCLPDRQRRCCATYICATPPGGGRSRINDPWREGPEEDLLWPSKASMLPTWHDMIYV